MVLFRYVNMWNSSLTLRALRAGGKLLHWLTRQPRCRHMTVILRRFYFKRILFRYKAAGIYKLYNKVQRVLGRHWSLWMV